MGITAEDQSFLASDWWTADSEGLWLVSSGHTRGWRWCLGCGETGSRHEPLVLSRVLCTRGGLGLSGSGTNIKDEILNTLGSTIISPENVFCQKSYYLFILFISYHCSLPDWGLGMPQTQIEWWSSNKINQMHYTFIISSQSCLFNWTNSNCIPLSFSRLSSSPSVCSQPHFAVWSHFASLSLTPFPPAQTMTQRIQHFVCNSVYFTMLQMLSKEHFHCSESVLRSEAKQCMTMKSSSLPDIRFQMLFSKY